jgi:hypothetical protein
MNLIRKYKVFIIVILPVLLLVMIRLLSAGYIITDPAKRALPSLNGSNIVTSEQAVLLPGEKLLISLDGSKPETPSDIKAASGINSMNIADRKNLEIIRDHKGSLLLFSSDPALSARIWMMLTLMGLKNIYIMTDSINNEVFKYKFQPDSLLKPDTENV